MAPLPAEVLAVGQKAAGAGALQGQPWVDEGCRTAIMVHEEWLRAQIDAHRKQKGLLKDE